MQTMGVSKFKAEALKILDRVDKYQEEVVITKRGKPLARIIPYRNIDQKNEPGRLKEYLSFEGDIVTPLGEQMWDACK